MSNDQLPANRGGVPATRPPSFEDLKFDPHPVTPLFGRRAFHSFPNGFDISVIKGPYSYGGSSGLYELALFNSQKMLGDPKGHLTPDDVSEIMLKVSQLPAMENLEDFPEIGPLKLLLNLSEDSEEE